MSENLILVTFADDSRAYEGQAALKQLDSAGEIALREAAAVARSDTGHLSVGDDAKTDTDVGALAGGFIGLLLGVLAGPVGVVVGAAAGVTAGTVYDVDRTEDNDRVLARIARDIPNGTTALVAAIDEGAPAAVDGAMRALGGAVARYARSDVEAELAAIDRAAKEDTRARVREKIGF
jgi:uncharacterized membrane protein